MKLRQVTLQGTIRRKPVTAVFMREDNGDWLLRMTIDGTDEGVLRILAKEGVKPCWTVACDYLLQRMGKNPSRPRKSKTELKLAEIDE